jgi:NAD-dependent deacetylase
MIQRSDNPDPINTFRTMLDDARRVVVFTGAGVSTESGIPDYRSPGTGRWNRTKPIEFRDFVASDAVRQESWARRFSGDSAMARAEPNHGHRAIARLIATQKALAVITQNIDNLHQRSGIPPEQVIELHGNATYAACLSCHDRIELDELKQQFDVSRRVEPCRHCGGIIKTATISFGQPMPEDAMRRAYEATLSCDLFLTIGSSLVVSPANGFPQLAKQAGAKLVILNREPTPLDDFADLVLHAEIGPTLSLVVGNT